MTSFSSMNRRRFLQTASASALALGVLPSRLFAEGGPENPAFAIRGFEFSGSSMWQWRSIDRALAMMERLGLNTLILHQNDLPDFIVWPKAVFSSEFMYSRNPVRTCVTCNGRNFLRAVGRRAARRNIKLMIEAKEMWYPDGLLELHPELMAVKGVVCPTHPFWWKYQAAKYAEVLSEVPEIAGVLISAGSRESKVTFANRNCSCDRCRNYDPAAWYQNLFRSIHSPLQAAGKQLVVRDYSYSRSEQDLVVEAAAAVSSDIVVSLTNTPHQFLPTFPDNPRIGRGQGNPQWVEFDPMGQFAGMGVFPASLVDDLSRRIQHAKTSGAVGVWFRADVEGVTDSTLFSSPNMLNLFAAALFAGGSGGSSSATAYDAWLSYGMIDPFRPESQQTEPVPIAPGDRRRFCDFMRASWGVLEKTLYVRGLVFTETTGQIPGSVERAFNNLLVMHGREQWEPGANRRIEPTESNLRAIFAEKREAVEEVGKLAAILDLERMNAPSQLKEGLGRMLDVYPLYVRGFSLATEGCFWAKKGNATEARRAAGLLEEYHRELSAKLEKTRLPHYVRRMLDPVPAAKLAADIRRQFPAG